MNDYTAYLIIPFLTAFVGWFTNWLGIKMMFYPTQWVGIGNMIGWQGIIPRMRVKFTLQMVNSYIKKICTPAEMMEAIQEAEAMEYISELISPHVEEIVDDIMEEQGAVYWELAPDLVKKQVYAQIRKNMPIMSNGILTELKDKAEKVIDIEGMAVKQAQENPGHMSKVMQAIAGKEFNIVIWSGLIIGFPLGILQAVMWYFYPNNWVLPLFGFFVGGFTNWIALQYLVYPLHPVKILGMTFQGVVLKRQPVVSLQFGEQFANNFLSADDMFSQMWEGEQQVEMQRIVRRQLRKLMDSRMITRYFGKAMRISGQSKQFDQGAINILQDRLGDTLKSLDVSDKFIKPISDLIGERMKNLPPEEYHKLITPSFEEDKWILIAVGGILGFGAGTAQLVYLFGGQLF